MRKTAAKKATAVYACTTMKTLKSAFLATLSLVLIVDFGHSAPKGEWKSYSRIMGLAMLWGLFHFPASVRDYVINSRCLP